MSNTPGPGPVPARHLAGGVAGMVLVGSSVAVSRTLAAAPLCTAQAIRYGLAGLVLLVLARSRHVPIVRPRGREWLWLAGIAAVGLVTFNLAIVHGTAHAQPTMIAVAVACVPVLLGVLGPVMQGQRPRRQVVLAAVIVTAGAAAVEGAGHADLLGLCYAALTLACEAGFTLLAVPLLGRHGAWGVSLHSVWLGAVMFAVLGLVTEGPAAATRLTADDLLAVGYLAAGVTVVAFILWYSAVAALGPGRAGLITGIAPVSAALVGIVTGSRGPTLLMWAGIAVVLGGLAAGLSARAQPAEPAPDQSPELVESRLPRRGFTWIQDAAGLGRVAEGHHHGGVSVRELPAQVAQGVEEPGDRHHRAVFRADPALDRIEVSPGAYQFRCPLG
jgi:drug/metabolite transporter (DMT)-like permease